MRIILFLLIFTSGAILGQNSNSSPIFIQLAQVKQAPVFSGCENMAFADCSLERLRSHFIENLDEELLRSLDPEDAVVILRFIIDSEGKVRSPKVQSKIEELKVAGESILKEMPEFIPGRHEGEKVNVVVNLPLKIEIPAPVSFNSGLYDTPAIAVNCEKKKEPKKCTTETVQHFFHNNFNAPKLKTDGEWLKTEIKFVVDREGKVTNVTAVGQNEDFNHEGIRVIRNLPGFVPATRDGKNIPMAFHVPIIIQTK